MGSGKLAGSCTFVVMLTLRGSRWQDIVGRTTDLLRFANRCPTVADPIMQPRIGRIAVVWNRCQGHFRRRVQLNRLFVLMHLAAVTVWVGGMFFAYFCLRPIAAIQLQPPQRLLLLAAVLGRFFAIVGLALVALWGSGLARFAQVGASIPANWYAMGGLATVMTLIFGLIVFRFHRRMVVDIAIQDWSAAAKGMNTIRVLVLINLILGFVTMAIAIVGW
jgi:uncharacterized membrane protein